MNTVPALRKATRSEKKDCAIWLLFNVVGSLVPLYVSALLVAVSTVAFSFHNYTRDGEFALYSAALLAPAAYQILREMAPPFPFRTLLGLSIVVLLIVSVALFVNVNPKNNKMNEFRYADATVVIYLISLGLAFWINLIDTVRVTPNIREIEQDQLQDLRNEFKKTEDQI